MDSKPLSSWLVGITCRRIGQVGSFGSIRLAKYGVISRRKRFLAEMPSISSGVRWIKDDSSSSELSRWLSCQRQLVQSLSGTSALSAGGGQTIVYRLVAGGS